MIYLFAMIKRNDRDSAGIACRCIHVMASEIHLYLVHECTINWMLYMFAYIIQYKRPHQRCMNRSIGLIVII